MGPATMSGTKITLDVAGQPFAANGTVLLSQALERFILVLRKTIRFLMSAREIVSIKSFVA